MVDSRDKSPENLPDAASSAEMSAARITISALAAALKNFGLFPSDHASTINLLAGVHKSIIQFIAQFGDLGFEINKTKFLYEDHIVHDGSANDENPAYVMYRDGLRWLEFGKGVKEAELKTLFQTFHHYREMPDEPEDDLVSALWRLDLRHIFYKASDEFWDVEPVLDFSDFDISGKKAEFSEERQDVRRTSQEDDNWESLRPKEDDEQFKDLSVAFVDSEQGLWHLTPNEKKLLEQDIKQCVEEEGREDIIGLMLLILNKENDKEAFEAIMNYLKEELRISLVSKEFSASYYLLGNIRKIEDDHNGTKEWSEPLWEKFYGDIVEPEMLSPLIPVWHELSTLDPGLVKSFTNVLRLLPPRAGETFAAMINKISSPNARSLMIEIIASFATRDMTVLESLLMKSEEDLGLRLMRVVNNIEDEQVAVGLMKKAATHQRAKVRTEAQKSLHRLGGF